MLVAASPDVHYPKRRWRISDENGIYYAYLGEDGLGDVKTPDFWGN
jgi:hypothetical protein